MKRLLALLVFVPSMASAQYTVADADAARAAAVSEKNSAQSEYSAAVGIRGAQNFYLRAAVGLLNYANPYPANPPTYTATPLQAGDFAYAQGYYYGAVLAYQNSRAQDATARRFIGNAVRFP